VDLTEAVLHLRSRILVHTADYRHINCISACLLVLSSRIRSHHGADALRLIPRSLASPTAA
jgi:hypothetical protein